MEKKTNKVFLQVGEKLQEFDIDHAERILRMPNNGGWDLPKDSKYRLDKKDGLVTRANRGNSQKSKEEADNS
jgi:hypothetical protein